MAVKTNSVAMALAVVTAILAARCARNEASVGEEIAGIAKPVVMSVVELSDTPEATTYSAIVAPNAQVDVTFRVSGYVVYLNQTRGADGRVRPLEPGAAIASGTILARVRATDYQAVVDKARGAREEADAGSSAAAAQVVEAQAALAQAEMDFERTAVLWQQESVTKPAYDGSKARLDVARAKVDAAKAAGAAAGQRVVSADAQLREAQIALDDTDLRSPLGGVLLERRVEVGTFAPAGTPAFVVADLHLVKARFNVPDTALRAFRVGQSLPLSVDAFPGKSFEGCILSIAPAADPRARSFEVVVSIVNPDMTLRSGMIASIRAGNGGADHRRPQIPIDALVHDPVQDRYLVYTTERKDGNDVVRALPVTPGPMAGNRVVIVEGLAPGQRIIVSGANLLRPGDLVREAQ
jgi:RND family efflux transporter MFP subunit